MDPAVVLVANSFLRMCGRALALVCTLFLSTSALVTRSPLPPPRARVCTLRCVRVRVAVSIPEVCLVLVILDRVASLLSPPASLLSLCLPFLHRVRACVLSGVFQSVSMSVFKRSRLFICLFVLFVLAGHVLFCPHLPPCLSFVFPSSLFFSPPHRVHSRTDLVHFVCFPLLLGLLLAGEFCFCVPLGTAVCHVSHFCPRV